MKKITRNLICFISFLVAGLLGGCDSDSAESLGQGLVLANALLSCVSENVTTPLADEEEADYLELGNCFITELQNVDEGLFEDIFTASGNVETLSSVDIIANAQAVIDDEESSSSRVQNADVLICLANNGLESITREASGMLDFSFDESSGLAQLTDCTTTVTQILGGD